MKRKWSGERKGRAGDGNQRKQQQVNAKEREGVHDRGMGWGREVSQELDQHGSPQRERQGPARTWGARDPALYSPEKSHPTPSQCMAHHGGSPTTKHGATPPPLTYVVREKVARHATNERPQDGSGKDRPRPPRHRRRNRRARQQPRQAFRRVNCGRRESGGDTGGGAGATVTNMAGSGHGERRPRRVRREWKETKMKKKEKKERPERAKRRR